MSTTMMFSLFFVFAGMEANKWNTSQYNNISYDARTMTGGGHGDKAISSSASYTAYTIYRTRTVILLAFSFLHEQWTYECFINRNALVIFLVAFRTFRKMNSIQYMSDSVTFESSDSAHFFHNNINTISCGCTEWQMALSFSTLLPCARVTRP